MLSEIRSSIIYEMLERVRKGGYEKYLRSINIKKVRHISDAEIRFDFPVTALIGPNGGGKSTVIALAKHSYNAITLRRAMAGLNQFGEKVTSFKRVVAIEKPFVWNYSASIIDRGMQKSGDISVEVQYVNSGWGRSSGLKRGILYLGLDRTLTSIEHPNVMKKGLDSGQTESGAIQLDKVDLGADFLSSAERVLGVSLRNLVLQSITVVSKSYLGQKKITEESIDKYKSLDGYVVEEKNGRVRVYKLHRKSQYIFSNGANDSLHSDFNFGAGELGILKTIYEIESLESGAMVLIEELENGVHPLAVKRLVEYFIDVSRRKSLQIIFSTHSDYALDPLPGEGVWSLVGGRLEQGRLSVESLRAVTGRIDREIAVFVEDSFAKAWVEGILRRYLGVDFSRVGVYQLGGDSKAVAVHLNHNKNPSILFPSLCFLDGDSSLLESENNLIFKLPGDMPESEVFNEVYKNLNKLAAFLSAAMHVQISDQERVVKCIEGVACTNRDPHLLFIQIGNGLGLISEEIVRGAFIAAWIGERPDVAERYANLVLQRFKKN